ncbi:Hypothetical protein PBC10988_3040 [Planctomycetales bacterium 10988]|nr:Hypothetical protein PBC10988_3040 [Planctomycetales bacterium 10988]
MKDFLPGDESEAVLGVLRLFAARIDLEKVEETIRGLEHLGDEAISGLASALDDPDFDVRLLALEVLREWDGDTRTALTPLTETLRDPNRIVRIAAASALVRLAHEAQDALPVLNDWLSSDDQPARLAAANLILRIDGARQQEMLEVFVDAAFNGDPTTRCSTAWFLSELRGLAPAALPLLKRMQDDADSLVRSIVAEELSQPFDSES